MSTAVEAVGFLMSLVGFILTGASLINDYWKISSVAGSVIISQHQFENLWHSCAENSGGIAECRDFESLLALPAHVQACRALMIVALLLGIGCMIISLLGLKCIKIGSSSDQAKAKLAAAGGMMAVLGGLCCMVACSWYAYRVVEDFNNPFTGGVKFELGAGLFIGWAGASLSIIGGILLCTSMKSASSGQKRGYYGEPPSKVYTPAPKSVDSSRAYV
ncbi:claudin 15-like a [Salarias fasciatus]|uniref:Claudin n=1 Tax=Salarias fasciatus TaxID=181472 RepID=A0A672G067_SALFA|nr:claudin-10-like [Salarias fasciatus]